METEQKIAALLAKLSEFEKKIGAMAVEAQALRADLERMTKPENWAVEYEARLTSKDPGWWRDQTTSP